MNVLVIAPHADDETIGCGGTIARMAAEGHRVTVAIMTGHGDDGPHPVFSREVFDGIRAEAALAHEVLGVADTVLHEIPAVQVAEQPLWQLDGIVHEVFARAEPEMVFVPFQFDLHEDHRRLFTACSVAWRPSSAVGRRIRTVYAYETPSETHWNFANVEPGFVPNVWIDISEHLDTKLKALRCFESQIDAFPGARSVEALEALARFRGSQMHLAAAEAFVLVRQCV
jgi:LmbE family N-acetylglucosaminyl deacetylase